MTKNIIVAAIAAIALVAPVAAPAVFAANLGLDANVSATAQIGGRVNTSATLAAFITRAKDRADQEITRRLDALHTLETRVSAMTKINASTQSNLLSAIRSQIAALTTLQAEIAAHASANATSSLRSDIQSITKSYRIFALVKPQAAIEASAGRVKEIADMLTALHAKLQARIAAANTDMSASVALLADMNAKIASANASAQAAIDEVAALQPDNGDQAAMHANTAALQDARAKVVAAQKDLNTARQDAQKVIVALVQIGVNIHASTSGQ